MKLRPLIACLAIFVVGCQAATENTDPHPYVGAWRGHHKGSNRFGIGTCILVAPDWVLTAAHVASPLVNGAEDRVIRISFPSGVRRKAVSAVRVKDQDLALARLNEPVTNIAPVALQSTVLTKKAHGMLPIVISGTSGGRKSLEGHKAFGKPPLMLRIPNEELPNGKGGDSGGAWILKQEKEEPPLLVAILSGGTKRGGKKYGRGIQPAAFRDWIDTQLATTGSKATWIEIPGQIVKANQEGDRKGQNK